MNEVMVRSNEMVSPPVTLIEASLKLPPRDMIAVRATLTELSCSNPETARASIYCVPVGKDPTTGLQKFKLGESVRMAEMAQNAFGRMFVDARIEEETATSVTVKAMLMDLQTLNIYPGLGTANYKNEARKKLAITAAMSIARRNAIMSMVKPYTSAILPEVKSAIIKGLSAEGSIKEALDKLVAEYAELGVTEAQIKAAMASEKSNADRVVLLIGILNAIRDNMVTAEEVFGGSSSKPPMEPPKAKPAQTNGNGPKSSGKSGSTKDTSKDAPVNHGSAAVMDAGKFEATIMEARKILELDSEAFSAEIQKSAGVDTLAKVPEDKRIDVLVHFQSLADQNAEGGIAA